MLHGTKVDDSDERDFYLQTIVKVTMKLWLKLVQPRTYRCSQQNDELMGHNRLVVRRMGTA